ncbi:MAG: hypothetical protein KBF88_15800 [Polyangiaceae bacterium]|nr:hypothetical protein [Polyangiaceae bacterium]
MYTLFTEAGTLGAWKELFCKANYTRCARYKASELGHPVPINLLPNGDLLKKARARAT